MASSRRSCPASLFNPPPLAHLASYRRAPVLARPISALVDHARPSLATRHAHNIEGTDQSVCFTSSRVVLDNGLLPYATTACTILGICGIGIVIGLFGDLMAIGRSKVRPRPLADTHRASSALSARARPVSELAGFSANGCLDCPGRSQSVCPSLLVSVRSWQLIAQVHRSPWVSISL